MLITFQLLISSVQLLSHVWLFVTPWTTSHQASLSITNSQSLCPLSRWYHPTVSSSVILFSSHLQSFPASGSFQMSHFFAFDKFFTMVLGFYIPPVDSSLKSRDIILPTKDHIVKAMVFQVVMYKYESWTIKKVEWQRIDAFELWCWRRFLRVPWTARSNQSILKEISPEYSLKGLMLKLKLQYFGHLMWRADSLEKTLMPGKEKKGRQRMRCWMASSTRWI